MAEEVEEKVEEKSHKPQYRDQDAQDHQEVVTPPELVDRIYSFLEVEDFEGKDLLEPCVGPGALLRPIIDDIAEGGDALGLNSLTVMDIQGMHITKFKQDIIKAKNQGDLKNEV